MKQCEHYYPIDKLGRFYPCEFCGEKKLNAPQAKDKVWFKSKSKANKYADKSLEVLHEILGINRKCIISLERDTAAIIQEMESRKAPNNKNKFITNPKPMKNDIIFDKPQGGTTV